MDIISTVLIQSKIYQNESTKQNTEHLKASLKTLEEKLTKLAPHKRQQLRFKFDVDLRNIKHILSNTTRDPQLRSYHDKIFKNRLEYDALRMRATEVFNEFLKGITFFEHEHDPDNPVPIIYHRSKSCGPRSLTREEYKSTRSCNIHDTNDELSRNKELIAKCYTERLIYDELFKQYALFFPTEWDQESSQDERHRNMLEDSKRDYESCHPNTTLQVSIKYDTKSQLPLHLTIRKISKRHEQEIEKKEYIRIMNDNDAITHYNQMYTDIVLCKRQVKNAHTTLYKKMSYRQPTKRWTKDPRNREDFETLYSAIDLA